MGPDLRHRVEGDPAHVDCARRGELQVALQVAEGKTDREVGAALFLSPKTVEFHLARVYRKLDLSSRAELIRRFAETREPVSEPVS